jgi:hypothetical protein
MSPAPDTTAERNSRSNDLLTLLLALIAFAAMTVACLAARAD